MIDVRVPVWLEPDFMIATAVESRPYEGRCLRKLLESEREQAAGRIGERRRSDIMCRRADRTPRGLRSLE